MGPRTGGGGPYGWCPALGGVTLVRTATSRDRRTVRHRLCVVLQRTGWHRGLLRRRAQRRGGRSLGVANPPRRSPVRNVALRSVCANRPTIPATADADVLQARP